MNTKTSWNDAHVLVTGAASGIGLATALELARRGARLALVDRHEPRLEAAREAVARVGRAPTAHRLDVADREAVGAFAERFVVDAAPLDLLVNNAGVAVVAPFTATSATDWDWVFGVNVRGPLELTRALLPPMLARGRGHLAFVASLAGLIGAPGMVAYSTTKFALVGFAEALRLELAGTGVDVTVVCPGYVRTGLHAATRYQNVGFRRFLDAPPRWYGLDADEVARALVGAVEAKRPLVALGPEALGWYLKRFSPALSFALTRLTARLAGVMEAGGCTS